jgi:catechol 2,3-dioxygenase-like lactoylglutathione lyase family enzyme
VAFHHLAIAVRDIDATHRFYTEIMGFELVKGIAGPADKPGGFAKHLFYDTGGDGMIAFWDIHDDSLPEAKPISTGMGLPVWVNHFAFAAADLDDIAVKRDGWLAAGYDCMEIDHGFCVSVYTNDPDGNLVEWCVDTAPYTAADKAEALAVLQAANPEIEAMKMPIFHKASEFVPA